MTLYPIQEKSAMEYDIGGQFISLVQGEGASKTFQICNRCGAVLSPYDYVQSGESARSIHAEWHMFIERSAHIFGSTGSG